jgi:hypothetical protein
MTWTTPTDLRAQVQKLWDKGDLLRPLVMGAPQPPRRLRFNGPSSSELTERFDEVRVWLEALRRMPQLRIVWREFNHRVLGANAVPDELWLDKPEQALALIGQQKAAHRLAGLLQNTREFDGAIFEAIAPWLEKRPLTALALADEWPRLLRVLAWVRAHPRPAIYLRQVDLPGVDSKFIEAHRGVLAELLDLTLPLDEMDWSATGIAGFARRYGFKDKPLRIRLRLLDPTLALLPGAGDPDITVTQAAFEQLGVALPAMHRVFITENEVNFLAFPPVASSLVIFGAGYGFDMLAQAQWLLQRHIFYWGDIDTHGFAILDQLRAHFPHVQSLLMDEATLMAHADHWGDEPQPVLRDLPRLTAQEGAVYNLLRDNRLRPRLRLEQERIGFGWVQGALASLCPAPKSDFDSERAKP